MTKRTTYAILKKDKTTKIKPFQFNLDNIQKIFPIVIRVYRFFFRAIV